MPAVWKRFLHARPVGDKSLAVKYHMGMAKAHGLLNVYLDALDLKSSEVRDKIYALLSFAKETAGLDQLPALLRPNYSLTDQQIFANFTRWWIREYRSLSIWSSVHCQRSRAWLRTVSDARKNDSLQRPTWVVPSAGRPHWWKATLHKRFEFSAGANTSYDVGLLTSDQSSEPLPRHVVEGYEVALLEQFSHPRHRGVGVFTEMLTTHLRLLDPTYTYQE